VLVVDGVVSLRERERETLERAGYAVRTAADGPAALGALRCSPVDLVLADAELPGMSGIELITAIRRAPGLGHIPVIVLVLRVTDEVRRQSNGAGANGVVLKSAFADRELLGAVARVLNGQR
jgi:two-component system chemotaxis sensor kinase CheA